MDYSKKRTWAEISLGALKNNVVALRKALPHGCKFLALVKSNAYGHGAVEIAKALENLDCDYLGVACFEEAKELRIAGITLPIIILTHSPAEFIAETAELNCIQALDSLSDAKAYSNALKNSGRTLKVHIKLETGMNRTGFNIRNGDVSEILAAIALNGIETEGIFTHFATADMPEEEAFTLEQFKVFTEIVQKLESETKREFPLVHCANSAAIISEPNTALDMVRAGIALYGCYPDNRRGNTELLPLLELKTRILQINDIDVGDSVSYGRTFKAEHKMRVAVIGIGYGDGLHRCLSGKIDVLIHGKRAPQIGRICMDMCMVDVTALENVIVDDMVTIFGRDGDEFIAIEELADKAETISYEMLCALTPRVPRIYL